MKITIYLNDTNKIIYLKNITDDIFKTILKVIKLNFSVLMQPLYIKGVTHLVDVFLICPSPVSPIFKAKKNLKKSPL